MDNHYFMAGLAVGGIGWSLALATEARRGWFMKYAMYLTALGNVAMLIYRIYRIYTGE